MLKYADGKWTPVTDVFLLTKTEAQVWLALLYLVCEPECARRYQYTAHRRETLGRVRSGCFELFFVLFGTKFLFVLRNLLRVRSLCFFRVFLVCCCVLQ